MNEIAVGKLTVYIHETREEMGANAACQAAVVLRKLLSEKEEVNLIFASSPSQTDLFRSLAEEKNIDWKRVNAFHMDEFIGIGRDNPASFANFLMRGFFSCVEFKEIFYINGLDDPEKECLRYAELLNLHPADIVFLGIGENGHIAFNDPHIADFFDPELVIINESLDEKCRQQQVADGWFFDIHDVPNRAVTISMYGLLRTPYAFVTVPGVRKAEIVKTCLEGPICTECPSTGIRIHQNAKLFIDTDSSGLLTL